MADPKSISIKDLSTKAKDSVDKAFKAQTALRPPTYVFGFIPPWWIGIVFNKPVETATVDDAEKLATNIHGSVVSSAPDLRGTSPGCVVGSGHIICGFILPPDVVALEE